MKFRFRLQKVLDLKRIEVLQIQKEMQEAQKILSQCEERLEQLRQQRSESFKVRSQHLSLASAFDEQLPGYQIKMEKVQREIQQALLKVEIIRKRLIDKDQEIKIIEKMKEKKQHHYLNEMEKEEAKELDDFSSQAVIRKQNL